MTTLSSEPMVLRISPSGAIAGSETNPPLVGGTATDPTDGSVQLGREWLYKGSATTDMAIATTAAGDVTGLTALQVDMRAGYSYDLAVDVNAHGTLGTGGGEIVVTVDGSEDGGATYTHAGLISQDISSTLLDTRTLTFRAHALLETPIATGGASINALRVQLKYNGAGGGATFCKPDLTILDLLEYRRP